MSAMDAKMAGVAMGGPSGGAGGASSPFYDAEDSANSAGMTVGTCETSVRNGFLRKVYTILSINFAITVGVACFFSLIPSIRNYVVSNMWLYIVGLVVGLGSFIALACIKVKPPTSTILLVFFVGGFSLMVGVICAMYFQRGAGGIVIQAFIATTFIFLSITAYIMTTKKDFSYLYGFLLAGLVSLIVLSLLTFVLGFFVSGKMSRWMIFGISLLGSLLMTGYLLYDTSLVVTKLGPDDWILAVIMLYSDVINLFLYILSMLSALQQ